MSHVQNQSKFKLMINVTKRRVAFSVMDKAVYISYNYDTTARTVITSIDDFKENRIDRWQTGTD